MKISGIRLHTLSILLGFSLLFTASMAISQVTLNTENINSSLKKVQKLLVQIDKNAKNINPEIFYNLGIEAGILTSRLTMQRKEFGEVTQSSLIKIVQERIDNLGVNIEWNSAKQRYFYDGLAFARYLELAPDGNLAPQAAYQLLELNFFKSSGNNSVLLQEAIRKKLSYLLRYPDGNNVNKVRIMLAIEYRDLSRIFKANSNPDKASQFIDEAINVARTIIESAAGTREAATADTLIEKIQNEFEGSIK